MPIRRGLLDGQWRGGISGEAFVVRRCRGAAIADVRGGLNLRLRVEQADVPRLEDDMAAFVPVVIMP